MSREQRPWLGFIANDGKFTCDIFLLSASVRQADDDQEQEEEKHGEDEVEKNLRHNLPLESQSVTKFAPPPLSLATLQCRGIIKY